MPFDFGLGPFVVVAFKGVNRLLRLNFVWDSIPIVDYAYREEAFLSFEPDALFIHAQDACKIWFSLHRSLYFV